jgi:hypothetical protein
MVMRRGLLGVVAVLWLAACSSSPDRTAPPPSGPAAAVPAATVPGVTVAAVTLPVVTPTVTISAESVPAASAHAVTTPLSPNPQPVTIDGLCSRLAAATRSIYPATPEQQVDVQNGFCRATIGENSGADVGQSAAKIGADSAEAEAAIEALPTEDTSNGGDHHTIRYCAKLDDRVGAFRAVAECFGDGDYGGLTQFFVSDTVTIVDLQIDAAPAPSVAALEQAMLVLLGG